MSLNQQRQQQQQQKLEIQRRLDQYLNAVKDLQSEIKVYYGLLERNDEPNQERFKQTAFKFLKFEKEMNNQIEDIQENEFLCVYLQQQESERNLYKALSIECIIKSYVNAITSQYDIICDLISGLAWKSWTPFI